MHIFTRLHLLFLHACPKRAIFLLVIWAKSSCVVWSSSGILLFVFFSIQLIHSFLHHIDRWFNWLHSQCNVSQSHFKLAVCISSPNQLISSNKIQTQQSGEGPSLVTDVGQTDVIVLQSPPVLEHAHGGCWRELCGSTIWITSCLVTN